MPIRPENRDRYPPDWPEISARIRERAGNECEACGAPNGVLIRRGVTENGKGRAVWRCAGDSAYADGRCSDTGERVEDTCADLVEYGNPVRVVLTVAHLDHQPENCTDENLRAWCQRCHNAYDAPMRAEGIRQRARARLAVADMFGSDHHPSDRQNPGGSHDR